MAPRKDLEFLTEIRSSSDDSTYTIKRNVTTGALSCNCKGWIFSARRFGNDNRQCKHTRYVLAHPEIIAQHAQQADVVASIKALTPPITRASPWDTTTLQNLQPQSNLSKTWTADPQVLAETRDVLRRANLTMALTEGQVIRLARELTPFLKRSDGPEQLVAVGQTIVPTGDAGASRRVIVFDE